MNPNHGSGSSDRPGSTVVDYIVKATYIQDVEIIAAETGIFNKLAENYSMILDSKKVQAAHFRC